MWRRQLRAASVSQGGRRRPCVEPNRHSLVLAPFMRWGHREGELARPSALEKRRGGFWGNKRGKPSVVNDNVGCCAEDDVGRVRPEPGAASHPLVGKEFQVDLGGVAGGSPVLVPAGVEV